FKLYSFALTLTAHVSKVLLLAWVDWQIFRASVFAYNHPFVNVLLRSNEKPTALLNVIQRIRSTDAGFHRHHYAASASADLAFERSVFAEKMTHESLTASYVHQVSLESDQAARRNDRFDRYARGVMIYCNNFPFAIGNRL